LRDNIILDEKVKFGTLERMILFGQDDLDFGEILWSEILDDAGTYFFKGINID